MPLEVAIILTSVSLIWMWMDRIGIKTEGVTT